MKAAFPQAKKSPNFHHRVSFVASYVRCLTDSEELNKAITHAEIFLSAYKRNYWSIDGIFSLLCISELYF